MFENWSALLGIDKYLTDCVLEGVIIPDLSLMDDTMRKVSKTVCSVPVLARHRQSVGSGTAVTALQRVRGVEASRQAVRKQCQPGSFSGHAGKASCAHLAEFAVRAGTRAEHLALGDENQGVRDVLRRTDLPGKSQVSHHPQVHTRRHSQHALVVVTRTSI